jgi:hypothetical protein
VDYRKTLAGAFNPIPKNVGFGIKTTTFDPGLKTWNKNAGTVSTHNLC